MTRERLEFGGEGERVAEDYLTDKGFRVLERSYRCKLGQIDLVMRDGDTIVFVEVKTRTSRSLGPAEEGVHAKKQRQITRAAVLYVQTRRLERSPLRFDVVAIQDGEIRHLRDAFRPSGYLW